MMIVLIIKKNENRMIQFNKEENNSRIIYKGNK
jgi:hypothetical protein